MSHRKIWLSAAFVLFLVGCGKTDTKPTKPLEAPELVLNDTRNGITWEAVEGASSYEITVDEETTTISYPGYYFETEYGDYEVSVVAVDDKGNKSEASVYNYESRVTRLGNLQFDGEKITWPGSDYFGLEYSRDNENFVTVNENYLTVEESGIYYFRTVKGFREEGHIFFSQVLSRCLIATKGIATPYVIEDASEPDDATLNEYYRKMKYTSGWEVAASYATIDENDEDYVTGNAVDFHTWYHGMYYMFEKQIALPGSYNEFDFTARASSSVSVVLSFQITHTFIVNGVDLNGVYIKYTIAEMPTLWHQYRVSLNDPAWKVNYNGTDYDFGVVANMISAAGIKVEKLQDMFPFFDVFQFRIKAAYANGGAQAHAYFDDVQLVNSGLESTIIREIIPTLTVQKSYAYTSSMAKGNISFYDNGIAAFRTSSPIALEINTTYAIADEVLTMTSTQQGLDFVATFDSTDGGYTLNMIDVTGSFAQYIRELRAEAITCMDDFEAYEETGIGWDKEHGEEERTGLRASYLCDAYVGGAAESPIGGKGWDLLSSEKTNYMYLDKENAHTGNNSAALINNGLTNRFMQWSLHAGSCKGIRGTTFSIWAKGGDKADATLRVGIYFVQPVGPSNHSGDANRKLVDFTVPMNSGWTEYTIQLDNTKVYYGFSLLTLSNAGNLGDQYQHLLVDDAYIFSSLSPWAA